MGDYQDLENLGEDDDYSCVLPFDTDDPEFVRGFQIGQLWERLNHQPHAVGMVFTRSAEMVMRMAERKGLPFTATIYDDEWTLAAIGLPADLDAEVSDT